VKRAQPQARIDGFLVQQMAPPSGGLELIVGLSVDRVFGPVVLFGRGGTAVELIADTTLELPPLNLAVARAQMARTRVWRLLQGYRNTPPADLDAVARALVGIGALAVDHPGIRELDINPLLAGANGVLAVDARIAVSSEPAAPPALIPLPAES
jgi:acetyltransferase